MNNHFNDTIAAQATPKGTGGMGVIRVSGKDVGRIAETLLGKIPKPRYATHSAFKNSAGQNLDMGIALYFKAPHSFTGEDVLELHTHGGVTVIDQVLNRVLQLGARLARPGEFTERAFLNNKMDLAQAESIADLIHASSEEAARSAIRSLQGEFSKVIRAMVHELIQLRTRVESAIDFPDEEIDLLSDEALESRIQALLRRLVEIQKIAKQGAVLRDGLSAVIAGKPNVGKSSLLNRLSGDESAIVTPIPGTTRDVLRETIHIDGIPLQIIDTAGLRETEDLVEKEGIDRAHRAIEEADVVLWVMDEKVDIPHFECEKPLIYIKNKIDLTGEIPEKCHVDNRLCIKISAQKNLGLDLLKNALKELMGFSSGEEGVFLARRRHLDALKRALGLLLKAHEQWKQRQGECLAEDLRRAQEALGEITGEFTSEDLLGEIFSEFCIGK